MRKLAAFSILFCILIAGIGAGSLHAQWVKDGIPITDAFNPYNHRIVSDGSGGAIVVWQIIDGIGYQLLAQRVDATGPIKWSAGGDSISTASGDQNQPSVIADGSGGAIVSWITTWGDEVHELVYDDIYVQRIDSTGARQWGTGGVLVRSDSTTTQKPEIALDAAGGVVITWADFRSESDYDIYAQRVDNTGMLQWTANGIAVCIQPGNQMNPQIISDGAGGSIITWQDSRSGDDDIYAQRLDQYGAALWSGGTAVCIYASYQQTEPRLVSDDASGAIIVWRDTRNFYAYLYGQRIDATGASQWTANGILMHAAMLPLAQPDHHRLVRDGAGGAIIVWSDARNLNDSGIYAQRYDSGGNSLWGSDLTVCYEPANQSEPEIARRTGGGAIVTWKDERAGNTDIFAQIFDGGGTLLLPETGGAVSTIDDTQNQPILTEDGAGGAIIVWLDYRTSPNSLYAQHVDIDDGWYTSDPVIISIEDISPDQGGWVRVSLAAAIYDQPGAEYVATGYNVWRRIEGAPMTVVNQDIFTPDRFYELLASRADEASDGLCLSLAQAAALGFPPGNWEAIAYVPAMQDSMYYIGVPTKNDSTSSGTPWEVYVVSVHTTEPTFYRFSEADSGYSVDNLAPGVPEALAGEPLSGPGGVVLSWDDNAEGDLSHYAVYRGETAEFVPGAGNLIGTPAESGYTDEYDMWHQSFYKVSAIDRHGNESPHAALGPDEVTGDETPGTPAAAYLTQNHPNPFNPSTRFAYGLPAPTHVRIRIYDAAGRLVRTLVDQRRESGTYHETWNGCDDSGRGVASGIYFYSLITGNFKETKKMVLLK